MHDANYVQLESKSMTPNYGYFRTPTALAERCNICEKPTDFASLQRFKSTVLWPALFKVYPTWCHGLQGTGDCVSWMVSHILDLSMSVRYLFGANPNKGLRIASEPIYGFGKCELFNSYGRHYPGMMGVDGFNAVKKFGVLLRDNYKDYDLRQYSGERAKDWGENPRKTHGVPDSLELFCLKVPSLEIAEVTDCTSAAALIEEGYPVGYCGNASWGVVTDREGIAQEYAHGAHAMALTGVLYEDKRPAFFWVANTGHGDHVEYNVSASGMPDKYSACGCWVPAEKIRQVLLAGDCYAMSLDGAWHPHTLLPECTSPYCLR